MKMRDNPKYENFRTKCLICGDNKDWKYLGSHINKRHKISVKSYKERFGLPYNLSLMDNVVLSKKQRAFNNRKEVYLKNILGNNQHQFKKGHNRYKKDYVSLLERTECINNIDKKDLSGRCPVCKTLFDNVYSHLFMAHNLIKCENAKPL
jgi:hypothetical protein